MVTVEEIRKAQRSHGPATVLAFGTATPANCVIQADYPDYYFRITDSDHMTDLKEKFKRMYKYSKLSTKKKKSYMIFPACFFRLFLLILFCDDFQARSR